MISREIWTRIIKDFQEKKLPDLIERELKISLDIPINRVISFIGPRRAGKTFFMFQIMKELMKKKEKERFLYVNFESDLLIGCDVNDMRKMMDIFYEMYPDNKDKKVYLFLDEIQNVDGWEKFVRSVMDQENAQIFITGSSSKLLSKEIATSLRGRTLSYVIYPFSFSEFLKAKEFKMEKFLSSKKKARMLNLLRDYLKGSYPEVVVFGRERDKILSEILDVTIYRDVVERYGVENIKVLKLLLRGTVSSKYFSVHKFSNQLKSMGMRVSKNTVYNYLSYLGDSLVLYTLKKYSKSYKEMEQTKSKIYFVDTGLLIVEGVEDIGRLIENVVFVELIRRGSIPNKDLFYFDTGVGEVDFVIKKGKKIKQLIQVTYSSSMDEVKDREIKSLLKASEQLKCKNLLVITWDYEDEIILERKKIKFLPLWKFLLSKSHI
ncbi:MAG: ATP-binding protein [Candidatus Aenigmarchaeota archaeon]|nr:ATP-binding protein [Candidatus Aenigmarchaeota archaeon]